MSEAVDDQWQALDAAHRHDILTRNPDLRWSTMPSPLPGQHAWRKRGRYQLTVIWSIGPHGDAADRCDLGFDWWLHVSCSRPDIIPTHDQMAEVKDLFVGPDRWAYSVWAPADRHINIHERVLHLWAPLDNEPRLPDFGRHGTI